MIKSMLVSVNDLEKGDEILGLGVVDNVTNGLSLGVRGYEPDLATVILTEGEPFPVRRDVKYYITREVEDRSYSVMTLSGHRVLFQEAASGVIQISISRGTDGRDLVALVARADFARAMGALGFADED